MITIRNQLVSSRAVTSSGTNPRRYITIHETANTARGANAQAHANLQSNGFSASWHIQVDDTQAIRSYPDTVRCWHAGDGSGHGNMSSIGIEICVNSDGNFARAKANAADVVRQLRAQYNIPRSRVVQHNHWSGKNCPTNLRRSGWAAFVASTDPSGGSTPAPAPEPEPQTTPGQAWSHRGLDYVNSKSPATKNHQLARSHQYLLNTWQRIRQTAWRTWISQGVWGRRIKPESSLARTYPAIRDDGYLASTWAQYAYSQARQAREAQERNAAAIAGLAKAMADVARGSGERVYAAVAEEIAEYDQRLVQVNIERGADE